jgi:hypothetical protein
MGFCFYDNTHSLRLHSRFFSVVFTITKFVVMRNNQDHCITGPEPAAEAKIGFIAGTKFELIFTCSSCPTLYMSKLVIDWQERLTCFMLDIWSYLSMHERTAITLLWACILTW